MTSLPTRPQFPAARPREMPASPHVDVTLERRVLAGVILGSERIDLAPMHRSDFTLASNSIVFDVLRDMQAHARVIDSAALEAELRDRGRLDAVGGADALLSLTDCVPTAGDFARLQRLTARRGLDEAAQRLAEASRLGEPTVAALAALDAARARAAAFEQPARAAIEWRGTSQIFAPLPATAWLSSGLQLCAGRPAMIAGYGASAKTLSAQALGLAVASGTQAWGHFPSRCGVVAHLDYEQGGHATDKRYQRLALGYGIGPSELGDRLKVANFPAVFLDTPGAVDAYSRACEGSNLVILDALRGATPTMDENDSSIRTCIDNLTRVSEKTGATFLLIHHAGKPKEGHSDPRTILRGSSGIFDACGCVFVLSAGKTRDAPRLVTQAKMPAEAEGAQLADFGLVVEDVADGTSATAGVRVMYRAVEATSPAAAAEAGFDARAQRLLDVVRANPGESQNTLLAKCGLGRTVAKQILDVLEDQGRVSTAPGPRGSKHYRLEVL